MKTGLILEGGAMRGLFSCGVLDVFLENHLDFDGMIGVSAGAAFGCNFKSRQNGRPIRYNKRFARDKRYCSIASLLKTGDLYNGNFCYHTLPETLDPFDAEEFSRNPMEFHLVATDVETGRPFYRRCDSANYDTMEWIRASASMPCVSNPVERNGRKYLDGGISDAIPLDYFESLGFDRNVVILTRPAGYRKKPSALLPLFSPFFRKMPEIYRALQSRPQRYNETLERIEEKEKKGEILVIRPPAPLPSGKVEHNPERMQATYGIGRAAGSGMLDKIHRFLEKEK